jgi:DNA-binding GntR family transcriptional regulator
MSPRSYQEIASHLAARIISGKYPVGSHLPTGPMLAEQYGVVRGTVQRALAELARDGVIKTIPGGRIGALVLRLPASRPDIDDLAARIERLERHVFGDPA